MTNPETGERSTEYYTYEVEVPYNYYILNVELENFNLSHVPVYIMSQDQLSMYATYMSVVGNVMLHCGDPIQYTSISSSYWQSHFYAFGRPMTKQQTSSL